MELFEENGYFDLNPFLSFWLTFPERDKEGYPHAWPG